MILLRVMLLATKVLRDFMIAKCYTLEFHLRLESQQKLRYKLHSVTLPLANIFTASS